MKVIIAGSRGVTDYGVVEDAVRLSGFEITEVVSGTARGVDQLGERWSLQNKVPLKRFPAEWRKHGLKAGYLRNLDMAEYADALIAVWDGSSRGTRHMIEIARKQGLQLFVYPTF